MSKYADIALRIHQIARHLEIDQTTLGRYACVSKQAAGKWFSGLSRPQHEALMNLKNNLNINPEWIMAGKGEMLLAQDHGVRETKATYNTTEQLSETENLVLKYIKQLNTTEIQALLILLKKMQPDTARL